MGSSQLHLEGLEWNTRCSGVQCCPKGSVTRAVWVVQSYPKGMELELFGCPELSLVGVGRERVCVCEREGGRERENLSHLGGSKLSPKGWNSRCYDGPPSLQRGCNSYCSNGPKFSKFCKAFYVLQILHEFMCMCVSFTTDRRLWWIPPPQISPYVCVCV